jgi:hypothetical protein
MKNHVIPTGLPDAGQEKNREDAPRIKSNWSRLRVLQDLRKILTIGQQWLDSPSRALRKNLPAWPNTCRKSGKT